MDNEWCEQHIQRYTRSPRILRSQATIKVILTVCWGILSCPRRIALCRSGPQAAHLPPLCICDSLANTWVIPENQSQWSILSDSTTDGVNFGF